MSLDGEEDDYMSDAVLAQCTSNVRPSLLFNPRDKRAHQLLKKKAEADKCSKQKSVRVQQEEGRAAGLQKQISSDNKGFQLLSRMGYVSGTSLGKRCYDDKNVEDRLKEPIPVEVKIDRKGLGQKTRDREKLETYKRRNEDLSKLADPEEFRQRALAVANIKALNRDVHTAQSTCRHLDIQKGKESPIQPWYWPKNIEDKATSESNTSEMSTTVVELEDEESDEDSDQPEASEILSTVTAYLRSHYLYCIWCGTSYDNEDDLESSCPGNSRAEH